ncbi:hypothetical protein BURK1_00006 [Burkholderiales bacterium]|nr:hypothetical protein BURK1_00006 [Burkholderiales bacterium]
MSIGITRKANGSITRWGYFALTRMGGLTVKRVYAYSRPVCGNPSRDAILFPIPDGVNSLGGTSATRTRRDGPQLDQVRQPPDRAADKSGPHAWSTRYRNFGGSAWMHDAGTY